MDSLLRPPVMIGLAATVVLAAVVAIGIRVIVWRRPQKLDMAKFTKRWQEVQRLCSSSGSWPLAVINADKLLDEALKKRRRKGKTMGERLVAAQRLLSDNDGVWFGHKLRNKVVHEDMPKLKQNDVQTALRGIRQALKDLGALK